MLPFASNLQITIAKCPKRDELVVEAMHNEVAVPIPGCGNSSSLCTVSQFQHILSSKVLQHSYDDMCEVHAEKPNATSNPERDHESFDDTTRERILNEMIGNIVLGGFTLGLAFAISRIWSLWSPP